MSYVVYEMYDFDVRKEPGIHIEYNLKETLHCNSTVRYLYVVQNLQPV
jgi:hypothetical protein